jgi:hypothetical protein
MEEMIKEKIQLKVEFSKFIGEFVKLSSPKNSETGLNMGVWQGVAIDSLNYH